MLVIGTVRRPHGLSGELSVQLVPGFPGTLTPGTSLLWASGKSSRSLIVSAARPHAGRILIFFEGIEDVDSARALCGGELLVAEAPPAPPDFYYGHEITGWRCESPAGETLGIAKGLEETPGGPLLTLETPERKDVLVPFVRPIVVEIDRGSRRLVLDLPEGLMEL